MKDKCGIIGTYRFDKFVDGVYAGFKETHNLITDIAFDTILKLYNYTDESTKPDVQDLDITYFAFGDGTTMPVTTNTIINNELARKAKTLKTRTDKKLVSICSLGTGDANFYIREVGVFSQGSGSFNTGKLLSHALIDIDKNSNITYNVYYTLNLSEG